jgi:hypothetical protein
VLVRERVFVLLEDESEIVRFLCYVITCRSGATVFRRSSRSGVSKEHLTEPSMSVCVWRFS